MVSLLPARVEEREAGQPHGQRGRHALQTVLTVVLPGLMVGLAVVLDGRLAWGAVVAAVAIIAIVERPALGGLALVLIAPAASGIAPGTPFPMLRPSEAAILGIGALFLVLPLRRGVRWNRLDWAVAAFAIGSIVMAAFHEIAAGTLGEHAVEVIAPVQYLLLYRIVASTLETRTQRSSAVRLFLVASIPVSLVGILQQLDIGPARELVASLTASGVFETWVYQHFPRATSVFPNWHTFGGYLAVVLLLGLARLTVVMSQRRRHETLVAMALAAAALALTQTITSILAVALGTVIILKRERAWAIGRWMLALGAVAVALFGSYLGQRLEQQWMGQTDGGLVPQTIDYRVEVWTEQYLPVIGRYWPLGYGTGVPPEIDWVYTESGYLALLLRGGIPLLAATVFLIANAYGAADRVARGRSGADRATALCVVALAIVLIPMNLVWPYLSNSGLSQAFFVVLGLVRAAESTDAITDAHEVHRGRVVPENAGRGGRG